MKRAEAHISAGKFTEAIANLKATWQILIDRVTGRFPETVLPDIDRWRRIGKKSEEFEDLDRWWKDDLHPKLQMLMLGVDPVRFAAFEGLVPKGVHIRTDDTIHYYGSLEDPVIHTAESADYCLTFVLDTVVRLQETGRVPQPRDYYRIEVIAPCAYYDVRKAGDQTVGELPAAFEITGADVGGGPWPDGESAWFWDEMPNEKTFMIRLSAAKILEVLPRAEYEEVRRVQYDALRQRKKT